MFKPEITLEKADERGEIYSITLPDNKEFMLLHSKPGYFRGGHSHNVSEVIMILSGKMNYHKRLKDADDPEIIFELVQGQTSRNAAGEPHMGEFLEDTWLIEYKNAPARSSIDTDYEPYRSRVRGR